MISEICNDVYKQFLLSEKSNDQKLFKKIKELDGFFYYKRPMTLKVLDVLFEFERKMIHSKGPSRQRIESTILRGFSKYTFDSYYFMDPEPVDKKRTPKEEEKYLIALKLVDFADELFVIKIPRDSFSNKRKSLILEMLAPLAGYYDLPSIFELCLVALKSKNRKLILSGIEFWETYAHDQDVPLSAEIIELLDEIILETKDHSIAVSALNLQIEKNHIDEFEALSRIDAWKEKYLR